jgi:hypothetical protein
MKLGRISFKFSRFVGMALIDCFLASNNDSFYLFA